MSGLVNAMASYYASRDGKGVASGTDTVKGAVDYQVLVQQKQTATAKNQGVASVHFEVKF